jgi:glycosyltransferase involved in cell wall biosynthesis
MPELTRAGAPVSVAVFAYNEANAISDSLDAIRASAAAAKADVTVHVLINGCTDNTEAVVRDYAARHAMVRPVPIRRGDKANAWNHYTHAVAPQDAVMHVFTDGDIVMREGTIAGFLERFAAEPEANGCAGLPTGGRSVVAFRAKLIGNREFAGGLYAVRGSCLMAFRERGVRLPFGMFGEDGLVATLIKYDLDTLGPINQARITACETALFQYESLSPWNPGHWRIYRNRRMRYAVRRQQANMLYPLLYEQGAQAMPAHVIDLYRARHALMEFGWNGIDTYFDWIAHKRIRRDIAADDRAKLDERAHLYS